MSGETLKPCPFCGRPGVRLESGSWDRGYSYRVGCKVKFDDKCLLAHGGNYGYSTQKEADEEWNKRATPPDTEVVPEGTMEARYVLDEIEAVLGEHKSAFSRVVEISIKNRIDVIRTVLTRHRFMQQQGDASNG